MADPTPDPTPAQAEVRTTEATDHPISDAPAVEAPIHEGGVNMTGPTHQMLASLATGPDGPTTFVLYREGSDGQPLVSIDLHTGKLTPGEDYDPNDAADAFWSAVEAMAPGAPKYRKGDQQS